MPPAFHDRPLQDWPRRYYQPGGGDAQVAYVVFGRLAESLDMSGAAYRTRGLPEGVEAMRFERRDHPEFFRAYNEGPIWSTLKAEDPALAALIRGQEACVLVHGEAGDQPTLNYLRDVVGVLTALLDNGGVAIHDRQTYRFWSPGDWRREIFDHSQSYPRQHTVIYVSREDRGGEWIYTHGMRKFGRPDISARNVPADHREAAIELCNRFIELQAFGGIIPDGQEIRMGSLPQGMVCHRRGGVDDPDFNNVRVEIAWPGSR